jgi:AcrR family transcriptional regulator
MDEQDPKALKRTRGGRERLLGVAAELFNTNGLSATSLQMIADRLGVTKPALYHHFRSRDDIVRALMRPVVEDAGAAARRFEELPACDRPAAARVFYTDFVVTHRQVIHMVFFDRKAMPDDFPTAVDALADRVSRALAGSDDPRAVAVGSTLVYGIAALVARRPDLDDGALRNLVSEVLARLAGL